MIVSSLIRKHVEKKGGSYDSSGCVIPLTIMILLAALVVQLMGWLREPKPLPLLPETTGLVQLIQLEDVDEYTTTIVTPPTETFEAELFVIGVFTEPNAYLPEETVSMIYTRDNWRFVQIDYKPGLTLKTQKEILNNYPMEEVVLTQGILGILASIWEYPSCITSKVEGFPGKCEITQQLFFEMNGQIISITADGEHPTEGELIGIARSILENNNQP